MRAGLRPLGSRFKNLRPDWTKPAPLVLYGNEQSQRLDQMRGEAEKAGSFVERFLNEAEFAEFEVAEAAVDQPGGIGGGGPEGEIGRIDEPDADAIEDEFARGGGTVDSAAKR